MFSKMKLSLSNINYRLYLALLVLGLCPTIYTTVRVYFLGTLPGEWSFSIAGQLSWVNLLYEIINEAIILPLFYFIGNVSTDKKEFTNRVKTGLTITLCIYLVLSAIIICFTRPLLTFMATDIAIIDASTTYIRIESIANVFLILSQFVLVALITINKSKYIYLLPEFAAAALSQFDSVKTLAWFQKLGLFTVAEPSGRVYPYSDQANSVVDVLRFALQKPNIQLLTGFEAEKIKKEEDSFVVTGNGQSFIFDKLIVACGGLAGTKLGGSMSGYKLLGKFGHRSTKLRPSLVQLKSSWNGIASLKGIRANCKAEIYCDDTLFAFSTGEVQFTEYGLSGPVIFEVSRDACQTKGSWVCKLDLMPDFPAELLMQELSERRNTQLEAEELLTGILHNRLGRMVVKMSGVSQSCPIADLSDYDLQQVCRNVKSFEVAITEPMGMDAAQVTAGGILTDGFNPETMESLLIPGLYACGEVLDIDGDCGGYNLQWAWSSGRCAGLHAGKE